MWMMLNLVFNSIGLILLIKFFRYKWLEYRNRNSQSRYWTFNRHKYILTLGGLIFATLFLLNFILPQQGLLMSGVQKIGLGFWLGMLTSLGISIMWAVYLRQLDVYEPEKWHHLFLVFVGGCITTFLVFPISNWINAQGFVLNGEILNDFLYCTIGIGVVEEFVKIIPFLVIMRFKKIVNEPYDYLLYASISALGFAFIENTLYIQKTSFYAINGRALMSTVAHMTFSAVIGYSFLMASFRHPNKGVLYIIGGFMLASLMHGFYDFWLINPIVKPYNGLSYLFLVLTIHYWFTLKNKAISMSYFFDRKIKWVNDRLRYYLLAWLVVLLCISSLLIGLFNGTAIAEKYFLGQIYAYGFMIYYLAMSFSRFKIAPKFAAACQLVIEKTIPESR